MRVFPVPPRGGSTTDFVVIVFVVTVATILIMGTTGIMLAGLLTDDDITGYVNTLADIMTTIIGALIGFIAGKGSGRAEVHEENMVRGEAEAQAGRDREDRLAAMPRNPE